MSTESIDLEKKKLKDSGYKWTVNQQLPKETMQKILGGFDELNVFKHSLEEINKSYFFNDYIKGHVWKNKLNPCYNVCGKGIQKETITL